MGTPPIPLARPPRQIEAWNLALVRNGATSLNEVRTRMDLTPITQYGKSEPIAYMDDRTGDIYPVEQDEPLTGQYEDAAVSYEIV